MRSINEIIIHCSATSEGQDISSSTIREWHKAKGWSDIGYHFVIRLDGSIEIGRSLDRVGAHCKGRNRNTIGICYVGGVSKDGKTNMDTRTPEQRKSLESLVNALKMVFNVSLVSGHNNYTRLKDCPCFNVKEEF